MKILLTLCRPVFPPDTGGKIRTLNIFGRLAKRAEVHAVSLAEKDRDAQAIVEMGRVFQSYTPVFWKETPKFSSAFYAEILLNHFSRFPYFLAKYRLPRFQRDVESLFTRQRFDALVCDGLPSAAVMLDSSVRPRIVFERNVEHMIRKLHWERAENPLERYLLRTEWKKARAIEAEICRSFEHVIAVSEEDRSTFMREFGLTRVSVIPTSVDGEFFRPQQTERRPGNLVFVGSMDWYPNEEGISWFLREVYPKIRQRAPHAILTIVGRSPSSRLRALAAQDASVEITGTVDDVRPFLARAEVVIVPLRIGSGTRIKIFEAMAMARPVVSTTLGAEGLPVAPGRDILLEDDPQRFADAVIALLRDASLGEAIGRAARERVANQHTWEIVADRMEQILESVVATKARSAAGDGAAPPVRAGAMLAK